MIPVKIKLLCLNIWYGGKMMEKIRDFVEREQPDVMLLQEVWGAENQFPQFPYHNFAPALWHLMNGERYLDGNVIYSKFPIVSSDVIFYDKPFGEGDESKRETFPFFPRNLQHVVIDAGGTKLNIFNTQGIWGEDGDDNERRLRMSDTIVAAVKDKENVILGGDFNVNDYTQSILKIEKYLTNIFKHERTTSFNMRRKTNGGYATSVVDNIFVSPDIKVLSHAIPDVDISDHLPMIAVLDI